MDFVASELNVESTNTDTSTDTHHALASDDRQFQRHETPFIPNVTYLYGAVSQDTITEGRSNVPAFVGKGVLRDGKDFIDAGCYTIEDFFRTNPFNERGNTNYGIYYLDQQGLHNFLKFGMLAKKALPPPPTKPKKSTPRIAASTQHHQHHAADDVSTTLQDLLQDQTAAVRKQMEDFTNTLKKQLEDERTAHLTLQQQHIQLQSKHDDLQVRNRELSIELNALKNNLDSYKSQLDNDYKQRTEAFIVAQREREKHEEMIVQLQHERELEEEYAKGFDDGKREQAEQMITLKDTLRDEVERETEQSLNDILRVIEQREALLDLREEEFEKRMNTLTRGQEFVGKYTDDPRGKMLADAVINAGLDWIAKRFGGTSAPVAEPPVQPPVQQQPQQPAVQVQPQGDEFFVMGTEENPRTATYHNDNHNQNHNHS